MKRHYVTIEVTVYAEDDEDAVRKSETLCKSIHQDFAYEPEVKEILEHRFHNFFNRTYKKRTLRWISNAGIVSLTR